MRDVSLAGLRVLVVEDEFLIADDLQQELEAAGAEVVGPAATVEAALRLAAEAGRLDGAILDVNLCGARVYPVADLLRERNVPFVLATGYDPRAIPDRYRDAPRSEKPIDLAKVVRALFGHLAEGAR